MDQNGTDRPSSSITSTLLQRAKELDNAAWEHLDELYKPFVYCWFRRLGISTDDAPDLRQEVFVRALKGIKQFQRDTPGSTFTGWLWTIASNVARDYFREKKPGQIGDSFLAAIPDTIDEDEMRDEVVKMLHQVLEMIRGDFKGNTFQIFWRCEIERHDTEHVARDYGMKHSAVREARRRVMKRLDEECLALLGQGYWPFESGN